MYPFSSTAPSKLKPRGFLNRPPHWAGLVHTLPRGVIDVRGRLGGVEGRLLKWQLIFFFLTKVWPVKSVKTKCSDRKDFLLTWIWFLILLSLWRPQFHKAVKEKILLDKFVYVILAGNLFLLKKYYSVLSEFLCSQFMYLIWFSLQLYCAQWLGKDNIAVGGCDANMVRVIDRGTLQVIVYKYWLLRVLWLKLRLPRWSPERSILEWSGDHWGS